MDIILNKKQHKAVIKLIKEECCNYNLGNCLLINGGRGKCPQISSRELCCTVRDRTLFNTYSVCNELVIPLNPSLYVEIMETEENKKKRCLRCNSVFIASSNHQKYCDVCSIIENKKKDAARKRKYRGKES